MTIYTSENRDAWQRLFDDVAKQRPSVGKHVRVTSGKHSGKVGIVTWHGRDKFADDYYKSDAQLALRDACGRDGFRVRIQTSTESIFVSADKVSVEASEKGQAAAEMMGAGLIGLLLICGAFLLVMLITSLIGHKVDLFAVLRDVLHWLYYQAFPVPMAGVLYQGWYPSISYDEKAKNLLARLVRVDGQEKAQYTYDHLLEFYGGITFEFIRQFQDEVFDAEQEAYVRS